MPCYLTLRQSTQPQTPRQHGTQAGRKHLSTPRSSKPSTHYPQEQNGPPKLLKRPSRAVYTFAASQPTIADQARARHTTRDARPRDGGEQAEKYISTFEFVREIPADRVVAAALYARLMPYGGSDDVEAEKNRRRALYKARYDRFADEAEGRRQRVAWLVWQNDRWRAESDRIGRAIETGTGDELAELRTEKENGRLENAQMNEEMCGVVNGAKHDVDTQRRWDAYFELRTDEPPS
ncbi:hypothetical protein LTR53_009185 [Teratosphaeriaceae sp. CCFEE 6253]|nr:hypothetical protein LTR53_009185 [Teratosphaeriaceae sp. CCFEE 6253]